MTEFYEDQAIVMQPVWVIDRNGSDGLSDPLITADDVLMGTIPEASQRPSTFNLPISFGTGGVIPDLTPIYRGNNGSVYTKMLNDLGFRLEETLGSSWPDALDDTVRLLLSPQRSSKSRPSSLRRGIMTHSERELGYAYKLNQKSKFVDSTPLVVTSANQTHTITFDLRAGGHITNWRVQMNTESIDNQIVNLGESYGRGMAGAIFIIEELGQPGQFRYNPTQSGDEFSVAKRFDPPATRAVFDWEAQAAPLLIGPSPVTNSDGSVTVDVTSAPLFFQDFQDHTLGGLHRPMTFPNCKFRTKWIFNWDGREGVHQIQIFYFNPIDILYAPLAPAPGPQQIQNHMAHFLIDNQFDQLWFYDAANDTEHHAVQNVEAHGYDGGEDNLSMNLTATTYDGVFGPISPPAAPPLPSGIGGVIWRDTGTHWGPGEDFAVGVYLHTNSQPNSKFQRHIGWQIQANYTTTGGQPMGKNGTTGMGLFCANLSGGGHPAGFWLGPLTSYFITDTFVNVKAKMRQLYLDGVM